WPDRWMRASAQLRSLTMPSRTKSRHPEREHVGGVERVHVPGGLDFQPGDRVAARRAGARAGRLRKTVSLRSAALGTGGVPERPQSGVPKRAGTRAYGRVELPADVQAFCIGSDALSGEGPLHAADQSRCPDSE